MSAALSQRTDRDVDSAAVRASGLAVGWNDRVVLRDVDLAVRSGERVALLGCNGSGKTTLLRVLAGLAAPLAGQVDWNGAPLPRAGARCRAVGYVLQSEEPVHFTVRQLVALGLGSDGPPSVPEWQRVARVLEDEGLSELADRACSSLSGGEWQRAVLARARVAEPRLLLLDEPTSHLDPARRAALHERLANFRREAVILATHDLELAHLCDRVMLLGRGRVMAEGAPGDVLVPETLAEAFGVVVRRVEDPDGGPALFRIVGLAKPRTGDPS